MNLHWVFSGPWAFYIPEDREVWDVVGMIAGGANKSTCKIPGQCHIFLCRGFSVIIQEMRAGNMCHSLEQVTLFHELT